METRRDGVGAPLRDVRGERGSPSRGAERKNTKPTTLRASGRKKAPGRVFEPRKSSWIPWETLVREVVGIIPRSFFVRNDFDWGKFKVLPASEEGPHVVVLQKVIYVSPRICSWPKSKRIGTVGFYVADAILRRRGEEPTIISIMETAKRCLGLRLVPGANGWRATR